MNDLTTSQEEIQIQLPTGENCLLCSYNESGRKVKLCSRCANEAMHKFELCEHFALLPETEALRRCLVCQTRIDDVYEEFWKEIVTDNDGNLDAELVKAELYDFHFVIDSVTNVYFHLTTGKFSKPNYTPDVIISEVERQQSEEISAAATEAVTDEKTEILAYIRFFQSRFDRSSLSFLQLETLHDHIERGIYKTDDRLRPFLEEKTSTENLNIFTPTDFTYCRRCQFVTGITEDFRCATCGELICLKCGCTESAACVPVCDWARPGMCTNCEDEEEGGKTDENQTAANQTPGAA